MYKDTVLTFGLHFTTKISLLHHHQLHGGMAMEIAVPLCFQMKHTIVPAKWEGPSTKITFLDMEFSGADAEISEGGPR